MYYVFAGNQYYPEGGSDDCIGVVEEVIDAIRLVRAKTVARGSYYDWWHLADDKMVIVPRKVVVQVESYNFPPLVF